MQTLGEEGVNESVLKYPDMRADIELCRKQLCELCRGEHGQTAVMSVPPQETDFDKDGRPVLPDKKERCA